MNDFEEAPEVFMEVDYIDGTSDQWKFRGYQIIEGWLFLHVLPGSAAVAGAIRLDQVRSIALEPPCVAFDILLLAGLKAN